MPQHGEAPYTLDLAKRLLRSLNCEAKWTAEEVNSIAKVGQVIKLTGRTDQFIIEPTNSLPDDINPGGTWGFEQSYTYAECVRLTGRYMWKHAQKRNKDCFVFVMTSEGYTHRDLKFWSDVFWFISTKFIDQPNWTSKHFTQIWGNAPHSINYHYMKQHSKRYKLFEDMSIICTNLLEIMTNSEWQGTLDKSEKRKALRRLNKRPAIKPYKFLFYNNHPKFNRVYLVGQIIRRNLHQYGLMSLNLGHDLGAVDPNIDIKKNQEAMDNIWYGSVERYLPGGDQHGLGQMHEYFPESGNDVFQALVNNKELAQSLKPLGRLRSSEENQNDVTDSFMSVLGDMHDHCSKCYFAIITETKFFHDRTNKTHPHLFQHLKGIGYECPITPDNNFLDGITYTEKTSKFILAKMPFILMAFPRSLEVLRQQGYKTFSPYINEAYDLIENDEDRAIAIANEIERLCQLSDENWLEIQDALLPRLEHNFNLVTTDRIDQTFRFSIG
jgi:hypothetical protein